MNEDYLKGIQIGQIMEEIRGLRNDVKGYREDQQKWNDKMDTRVTIAEKWIQTTTGKVVVLTFIFGAVGSLFYVAVTWVLNHYSSLK